MTETRPSCKDRHHAQSPATWHSQALWNHVKYKDRKHPHASRNGCECAGRKRGAGRKARLVTAVATVTGAVEHPAR